MAPWEQVLDDVVRTRRAALVGYACLFAPPAEAEDLVQEALVRTFARRRSFEDAFAAEGYVRAAVRTAFLDRARRRKAWDARAHLFVASDARSPEAAVTAGVDVGAALALLAPRERTCVVLRYFDDMLVADIAAELSLSEGAVRRYLSDAVGKLRQHLGDRVTWPDVDAPTVPVDVRPEPASGQNGAKRDGARRDGAPTRTVPERRSVR